MVDPRIIVGYVEAFDFSTKELSDRLSGHPKAGRVYRIFETEGNYMLHIGAGNTASGLEGIALGESLTGSYEDKWRFTVIPITPDNYLDYPICEDDLKSLLAWFEDDHSDLKRLFNLPIRPVSIEEYKVTPEEYHGEESISLDVSKKEDRDKAKAVLQDLLGKRFSEERKNLVQSITGDLNFLMDADLLLVEVIADLFGYIAGTYADKYEDENTPNISKDIQMSKSLGKGANVYSAIKHLHKYSTSGYEGSNSIPAMQAAIHYCLFELQRRKLHE